MIDEWKSDLPITGKLNLTRFTKERDRVGEPDPLSALQRSAGTSTGQSKERDQVGEADPFPQSGVCVILKQLLKAPWVVVEKVSGNREVLGIFECDFADA